jgi:methylenetetrahydrofolate dehydrogenase (NADP+)/methenyltetrahydrofolate cyclohydrolase
MRYIPRPMIIDGKAVAARVRAEVASKVAALRARGVATGLTVVRVGEDPASAIYVRGKRKACDEAGIVSVEHHLPATTTQVELLALVARLNADPAVHGILVQLPLPRQIDEQLVLEAISPAKDADGFHPFNVGCLWTGKPGPRACTPFGVMRLLDEAKVELKGRHALVIGRSNIVGKPQAAMLLERHATVTMAHSRTAELAAEVARADVVVAAIGKAELVKGAWIKPGAVVIDVGMNRQADGKLLGDVEFGPASQRASAITPVPGGVGPMTIAMLLANTVELAARTVR